MPYNSFFEKKAVTNGHSYMNGHALKTNGHPPLNGHSEQGHSDFMRIQRYEDLIGMRTWVLSSFQSDFRQDCFGRHHLSGQSQGARSQGAWQV